MSTRYGLAAVLLMTVSCGRRETEQLPTTLSYVATVAQFGPVAYRDPLAAVSPDGVWLATARARHVAVQHVAGGPVAELDTIGRLKSFLVWLPDSRHFAVFETAAMSDTTQWVVFDAVTGQHAPLWAGRGSISGLAVASDAVRGGPTPSTPLAVAPGQLRELAWSADGRSVAGVVDTGGHSELWIMAAAKPDSARVQTLAAAVSYPTWVPDSRRVACVLATSAGPRVSLPCGAAPDPSWAQDVYGPLAFSPDGARLYYATPNARGTLDLWMRELVGGRMRQLTHFARDTYAPTTAIDGRVFFKLQEYSTSIGVVPVGGGTPRALTAFMSETPLWDWSGTQLAVTYGNWRRVIDDARYPDIAQDVGIVRVDGPTPARAPSAVVQASPAEDQSFCWSPNGRWIAFHSHEQQSDDIWLEPADRSAPPRRVSARGLETGWPRWSRNGRWIAYPSHVESAGVMRSVLYIVPVDQTTGVTQSPRAVPIPEPLGELVHAEWMPDAAHLVIETGDPSSTAKALYVIGRVDGHMRRIAQFRSEQLESGIGLAPDGGAVAYVAPAADGFFQIFVIPVAGGQPRQLTTDPTNKTQPAWSPDGGRIAFTVWSYKARIFTTPPDRSVPDVKTR